MTDNEQELLNIIRGHHDPARALEVAVGIITAFLQQSESSQEPQIVYPPESA